MISDEKKAKDFLSNVNYYRLRGFLYPFYDNSTKTYIEGTEMGAVTKIYEFNSELSSLLSHFLSKVEVALRAHLVEAFILSGDALSYMDASYISNKHDFWMNMSSVSKEINRSSDVFIKHQFDEHDGLVPVWGAVEVMSFGTLSKIICSLGNTKKGNNPQVAKSMFQTITRYYQYSTAKNNSILPKPETFSSWLICAVLIRNICAHNSRLYNRAITKKPEILNADVKQNPAKYYGVYEALLALKYIRPSDDDWNTFIGELKILISQYASVISLSALNFPEDWEKHFEIQSK